MRPNITITIPEPYLPLEEYCRRTGLNRNTADKLISDGRLPIKPKGAKKKGLVEVNMAALTIQALSECYIALTVSSNIHARLRLNIFDFKVSIHKHFDDACSGFAKRHNLEQLAEQAGMQPQTLRNKLTPEQVHQLTVRELLTLTDFTEDSALVDGALAQLNCLPCVPVNEVADEKFPTYVLKATAEVGMLAANAANQGAICNATRRNVMNSVNMGIRCLTLAAIAVQSRIHSSPTLSTTVDAISGIGASTGMS